MIQYRLLWALNELIHGKCQAQCMVPYRPYNFNTITIRLEVQKGMKCICLLLFTYCQPLTQSQAYGCCLITKLCLTLLWPPMYCDSGFPGGSVGKEPACQCRRHKRHRFSPWVGKIPWRRAWQNTPVHLPRESHGPRSLAGYSPQHHTHSKTQVYTKL